MKIKIFSAILSIFVISSVFAVSDDLSQSNSDELISKYIGGMGSLGSINNPIKVGVLDAKPFAYKSSSVLTGLVVDLWEKIAKEHNWYFVYKDAGLSYTQAAVDTGRGDYDIAIGNFSSTYQRSQWVNFSRPYILNYVAIATKSKSSSILNNIYNVFLNSMLPILIIVLVIFIFASILFWFLEHRKHTYNVSDSLFSTSIAMLSGNVIDNPSTNLNRFIFICILITGTILQAMVIATITDASLALKVSADPYANKTDIKNHRFVVEKGSAFVEIIKRYGGKCFEVVGADSGEFYLNNKDKFDGIVSDHAIAYDIAQKDESGEVILSNVNLKYDELVFYFNKKFPYAEKVNRSILRMQDTQESEQLCASYLGVEADLCVL
ncbi:MAG: transporter substrate-binding domain-containing protein [Legionellales bacterium]|nr:transporter substrate-binding domain-containing protein [Legionellales bacterium]